MFNYILTVHQAGDHLKYVLDGVMKSKGLYSKIYVVLDGCTDNSEEIVDKYPVIKLKTANIREIGAINHALKVIKDTGNKALYNIILQDDVVILEHSIEEKLLDLYAKYPKVGVVGMRHGVNVAKDCLTSGKAVFDADVIQNSLNSRVGDYPLLDNGEMAYRHIVYKSPICIPTKVIDVLGGYDERFMPIYHEDAEYCTRSYDAGFDTAVLGITMYQPREWSGCARNGESFGKLDYLQQVHADLYRELHQSKIEKMIANYPSNEIIKLW
jgi:GT2 family glycosyltransferase